MTDQIKRPAGPARKPMTKPKRKVSPHEVLPAGMKTRPLEKLHLARHHLRPHHESKK